MYNICFTYRTMFHPERGGVESVTDSLAREFIKRGHKIFYLVNVHDKSLEDFNYPTEHIYFPDESFDSEANHTFLRHFLNENDVHFIINQSGAYNDSRLFCDTSGTKTKTISCIHTSPFGIYPNLFNKIARLRDSSIKEKLKRIGRIILYPKIKKDFRRRLTEHYGYMQFRTDKVALLSETYINELSVLNPGIKPTCIPNPSPIPLPNEEYIKENIIIWVGRMDDIQKRPDRMLRIWRKISDSFPDWELVMIGDGPEYKNIKKKSRSLKNIHFTGYCTPVDWYKKAKILCLTSSFEGLPMVLIESISSGVVPVAFNSFSSLGDIIVSDIQSVAPFSESAFADNLKELIQNPELLESIKLEGYKKAGEYSVDKIADKWESLFNELSR